MFRFQKIKAGALQYVLVISVIIAILVFTFISLRYLQQKLKIKNSFSKEAILNAQNSFDYLKTRTSFPYNEAQEVNLSDNLLEKTTITKTRWGLFDVVTVEATVKNERFYKMGLLGEQNPKKDALYLKENNQALVVVGNTKITGNAALPKQGVKRGNISGTSYYGSEMIYGTQKKSTKNLPTIQNLETLKKFYSQYKNNDFENFELEEGLQKKQSFKEKTLLFESSNTITLANVSLTGNLLIVSKTAINVEASALLEDVILMAPKIYIASSTKGNFQAIAHKKIEVATNCILAYPTALVLLEREDNLKNTQETPQIILKQSSTVKGSILFASKNKNRSLNAQIIIEEKANVIGEVYCERNLSLQGSIYGSVFTHQFLTKKSGSIYLNHLYNGIINVQKLPTEYSGLFFGKGKSTIAKWVH